MASIRRVCVFCGSQPGGDPAFPTLAEAVGRAIAARGWGLVYGGAKVGTMGAVADAALRAGGTVYGVIPEKIGQKEIAHDGLDELFVVDGMHARKSMMAHLSDAFVVLPGGYGTLDETFEALTWTQLGYHRKPLALLGIDGFWNHLLAHLDHAVQAGFLRPEHRRLVFAGEEVGSTLDALAAMELPPAPRWIDKP